MNARNTTRLLLASAGAGALLLTAAQPAGAHVTITPTTTAAGASTVLTVSVGHGCDGSPTTRVAIQIPEEILTVTPTRNPQWTVTKQTKRLKKPVSDAHGNEVTERDAVVVYTARTPLPDGYRDAFELSLKLPEQAGETLAFPTIQTCQQGETAWTEVAPDGQDPEELENPAPTLTITAAEDGSGVQDVAVAADRSDGATGSATASDSDDEGNALGGWGLGAGIAGLLLGGTALVQVQRRARNP